MSINLQTKSVWGGGVVQRHRLNLIQQCRQAGLPSARSHMILKASIDIQIEGERRSHAHVAPVVQSILHESQTIQNVHSSNLTVYGRIMRLEQER